MSSMLDAELTRHAFLTLPQSLQDVDVSGTLAYLAGGQKFVHCERRQPGCACVAGSLDAGRGLGGTSRGNDLSTDGRQGAADHRRFQSDQAGRKGHYDTSDSASPWSQRNYAYVADRYRGLRVIDIGKKRPWQGSMLTTSSATRGSCAKAPIFMSPTGMAARILDVSTRPIRSG